MSKGLRRLTQSASPSVLIVKNHRTQSKTRTPRTSKLHRQNPCTFFDSSRYSAAAAKNTKPIGCAVSDNAPTAAAISQFPAPPCQAAAKAKKANPSEK